MLSLNVLVHNIEQVRHLLNFIDDDKTALRIVGLFQGQPLSEELRSQKQIVLKTTIQKIKPEMLVEQKTLSQPGGLPNSSVPKHKKTV